MLLQAIMGALGGCACAEQNTLPARNKSKKL